MFKRIFAAMDGSDVVELALGEESPVSRNRRRRCGARLYKKGTAGPGKIRDMRQRGAEPPLNFWHSRGVWLNALVARTRTYNGAKTPWTNG